MNSPVKILIVDDDEDDYFIIKEYITDIKERAFIVDWCPTYKDAVKKINAREYHLYFVDYLLGAKTGLDLIEESIQEGCEEPFILLTGNGNRCIDTKAMESGAVDYLVKSELNTEKLERCIRYSLERTSFLKALKNNERNFRNIFERSKDTLFIADEELVITEVNNASFNLLEYKKEELLNKSLYFFLADPTTESAIRNVLDKADILLDKEIDLLTKNGESKKCIITLTREIDNIGNTYIQGIIHDITALKKAETATLTMEKMKMASHLARTLAHEVRNPLNSIMLATEQIDTTINEEMQFLGDIIKRNSKRINDLITDLLNSSRPRQISLQKKTLQSILDETIEAAADRIKIRNIQLQTDYISDHAWVLADYEKLKIAFLNIIINAVEAMEDENGKLIITLKKINEIQYLVSIEDNGCGIVKENLVKLFDPYFTTKQNGFGLGLASTLNILQSHNVAIDVDSKVKKGTTFKLFFNKA